VPLPARSERRPQNIAGVSNLFAGIAECLLMAHRNRSHFGGRTSLSGHNGHGWSGGRPDPDANDPKRTLALLLFRAAL
jgi:hypothetical protein